MVKEGTMRHSYKKIVAYNPAENTVSYLKVMTEDMIFDSKASDESFYDVFMNVDKVTNVILGISLTGDLYQLSPAAYGTYIKEDDKSVSFINKSRFLCAVADYHKKNNIPFGF